MRPSPPLVIICSLSLAACQTTRNVAVTTWRVVDAPAQFVRHRIDPEPRTTTTQTTTVYSDVGPAGHPVAAPTPVRSATPRRRVATSSPAPSPRATPRHDATPRASASAPAAQQEFPVAKSVPGKPGFVYSPFDSSGAMIDVTGYQSGTKVKDPDTKKIFVVP